MLCDVDPIAAGHPSRSAPGSERHGSGTSDIAHALDAAIDMETRATAPGLRRDMRQCCSRVGAILRLPLLELSQLEPTLLTPDVLQQCRNRCLLLRAAKRASRAFNVGCRIR